MVTGSHALVISAAVCTAAAAAALYSHAALRPQSQIFGQTLVAGSDPRQVALTYDDGPNDAATLQLLELLSSYGAPAAFFTIGRFVRERPQIVRAVHAAGHIVGNHTYSHPWLSWQSARRVREELYSCNAALEDTLGAPVRYFRPPHGARRPLVMRVAEELGLTTVQWNAMGADWNPISAEDIVANIEADRRRNVARGVGTNILLHDGWDVRMAANRDASIRATATLLERYRRDGQEIVSLDAWQCSLD